MPSRNSRLPMTVTLKREHILLLILLSQMLFLFIPDGDYPKRELFLLEGVQATFPEYVYYHFEHLAFIALAVMLLQDSRGRLPRMIMTVWLFISIGDWIDYSISYNNPWWYWGSFPISWNVLQVAIFGFACLVKWWEERKNGGF